MRLADRNGNKLDGLDIVLAIIAVPVLFFIAFLFWPVSIGGGKNASRKAAGISNVKQIVLAMKTYSQDWDDHLPPAANWETCIRKYVNSEKAFTLPGPQNPPAPRFAFNAPMSGINLIQLESPESSVLVFETDSPTESSVGGQEMVRAFPESKVAIIGFGDLHVTAVLMTKTGSLNWSPKFKQPSKSDTERTTK